METAMQATTTLTKHQEFLLMLALFYAIGNIRVSQPKKKPFFLRALVRVLEILKGKK